MKPDFGGYVSKYGVRCTDGRIIDNKAFAHCDGKKVPMVWQHLHDDPGEVLGHVILKHLDDGLYGYGYFNETDAGKNAKALVSHGDIDKMSICANQIQSAGNLVKHGNVFEVSLVYSAANPGAFIDDVQIQHGNMLEDTGDVVIYSGECLTTNPDLNLQHNDKTPDMQHADGGEKSIGDILRSMNMTPEQKEAVYGIVAMALGAGANAEMEHSEEGDDDMNYNAFDQSSLDSGITISHAEKVDIMREAVDGKRKLSEVVLAHAQDYGIENIDLLFPEAKNIDAKPQWIKRDTDWVPGVLAAVRHSPFSRIKNMFADITADEARAKGYIKGHKKKDEIFKLLTRSTSPKTIYKRQKFDRDDLIDATELDVVPWIKAEMRMMLDEEIARAIMISDGRAPDDEDKIDEEHIRPIATDDPLYAHKILLPASVKNEDVIEEVLRARKHYKGSGSPTFYSYDDLITDMLLVKDANRRRIYSTEAELASAMRVSKIVNIPLMEGKTVMINPTEALESGVRATGEKEYELLGIVVNLSDYTIGADRGGQVSMFDDFDIDYNQYKYLLETRISGALTKYKAALVILREKGAGGASEG